MVESVSKRNSAEVDLTEKTPECQVEGKGTSGISCIWYQSTNSPLF